jgi:hypothetical protein
MTSHSKNIYLHIGLHKTGSTTLQSFLKLNQSLLKENGYLYPFSGLTNSGHHNLPWQLTQDRRFRTKHGTWDDLHLEISSSSVDNIILSSEDFESLNLNSIDDLKNQLQPYNTKVIVYLRRQDSLIQSVYIQQVKGGYKGTFSDFLRKAKNLKSKNSKRFCFDLHLNPWKERFTLENIIVRPLETKQLYRENLCYDFLKCIQCDRIQDDDWSLPKNLNESPDHQTVEILRFISNVLAKRSGSDSPQDFEKRYLKPILKYYRKNQHTSEKFHQLSQEESWEILNIFAASNRQVARDYLSRADGQLFYEDPQEKGLTSFDIFDLSNETLLEIMLVLFHEIWKEIDPNT